MKKIVLSFLVILPLCIQLSAQYCFISLPGPSQQVIDLTTGNTTPGSADPVWTVDLPSPGTNFSSSGTSSKV